MGRQITEYKIAKTIFTYGKDIIVTNEAQNMKQFIQHGNTSVFEHAVSVAKFSIITALWIEKVFKKKVDYKSLVRGALLHDYFLYDWHDKHVFHNLHGFTHPITALNNATRDFDLNNIERDIIRKHMFPLTLIPPKHIESAIVCFADKRCALCETFKIDVSSYLLDRINLYYGLSRGHFTLGTRHKFYKKESKA